MPTTFYAGPIDGVLDGTVPAIPGDAAFLGGRVHALVSYIDLAANAVLSGDTIRWGKLPKGAVPIMGFLDTSVSLGSATIDVGIDGTAAKFKAAATLTGTDTVTWFGKAAAIAAALDDEYWLQSVIAAANMPNSATNRLVCVLFYTLPHGA